MVEKHGRFSLISSSKTLKYIEVALCFCQINKGSFLELHVGILPVRSWLYEKSQILW